jgi:hypothetical protein
MKILKPFTNWLNKTGEGSRKTKKARKEFEQLKTDRTERIARESANRVLDKMKLNKDIGHISGPLYSALSSKNLQTGLAASTITNKSAIHIDGENNRVSINAPLEVNGRNVLKELDEMRDSLLLLKRDVDMEAKYPRLRELKDEYEQALEKYKTFERLK